jgi:hypothetical protein
MMTQMITPNFFNFENQPSVPIEQEEIDPQSSDFAALLAGMTNAAAIASPKIADLPVPKTPPPPTQQASEIVPYIVADKAVAANQIQADPIAPVNQFSPTVKAPQNESNPANPAAQVSENRRFWA